MKRCLGLIGFACLCAVGCNPNVTSITTGLDTTALQQGGQEVLTRLQDEQLQQRAADAKGDLDKVLKGNTEYDIVFAKPVEGDEQVKQHQGKMQKMDRLQIDNVEVAYEQTDTLSCNSKMYKRHFRILYVRDNRVYGGSYYTMEEIDGAAFVMVLRKMVPIMDAQMSKYHVEVKRGS